MNVNFAPLKNKVVRQAINYAMNRRLRGPAEETGYLQAAAVAVQLRAFVVGD